jgi:hypothetical protein
MGAALLFVERGGRVVRHVLLWLSAVLAATGLASMFGMGDLIGFLCLTAGLAWAVVVVVRRDRRRRFLRSWNTACLTPAVTVLTDRSRWWAVCSAVGLDRTSDLWVSGTGRKAVPTRVRVFPSVGRVTPASFGATVTVRGVAGQAVGDWVRLSPALAAALEVSAITVSEPRPGIFELALRTSDPLATPWILDAPVVAEPDVWGLPLGIDENGHGVGLPLANVSGVLVGGTPGSGKSAWLGFALAGFAVRDDVQLAVVDGRGGHDHDALAPRCWRYVAGDDAHDLSVVLDALRAVRTLARERISNSVGLLYGHHNLWSAGPSARHPAVFVVIDEFQAYMPSQFTSKADKETAGEITSIVTDLVKRGRSAGIVVFLATQRPTTDSIPSALRDNCGNRVCFSVMNRDSAEAVLGVYSVEGDVSPIRQPTGIGVAVVNGDLVRFRAPFVASHLLAEYVSPFAGLAADPLDLLSSSLAVSASEEDLNND